MTTTKQKMLEQAQQAIRERSDGSPLTPEDEFILRLARAVVKEHEDEEAQRQKQLNPGSIEDLTIDDLIDDAIRYDVGTEAHARIFGDDLALSTEQINKLGQYVLDERKRKYHEGAQAQARVIRQKTQKTCIITNHDYPPIPDRGMDWSAWDDRYGCEEGNPVGRGATEYAAIADLIEQLLEKEET